MSNHQITSLSNHLIIKSSNRYVNFSTSLHYFGQYGIENQSDLPEFPLNDWFSAMDRCLTNAKRIKPVNNELQ
jgi:hypothetical protein